MLPTVRAPHFGWTCFRHADSSGRNDDGFRTPRRCWSHCSPIVSTVTAASLGSMNSPRLLAIATWASASSASRLVRNPRLVRCDWSGAR